MPVPEDAIVCRFIRRDDWSIRDSRPRPGAFKQADLSVWHRDYLLSRHVLLKDLCIEHLTGCGQAHHAVADYLEFAWRAAQCEGTPFQVQVEWRLEDQYVEEPWRLWRDAHVQVEAVEGPSKFLVEFRRLLALNSRYSVSPEQESDLEAT